MAKNNKYIVMSFDDENTKKVAEVISNGTCKKIVNLLAEEDELSEKEISEKLDVPINTVEYNLKKLIDANLIEKGKHFWSKKGRKIDVYKLSNKSIIISPKQSRIKSKLKSVLTVLGISALATLVVKYLSELKNSPQVLETAKHAGEANMMDFAAETANANANRTAEIVIESGNFFFTQPQPAWTWFFGGILVAILVFTILNWRKL